jgi:hypothetical protein
LQLSGHTHGGQVCIPIPQRDVTGNWTVHKTPVLAMLAILFSFVPRKLRVTNLLPIITYFSQKYIPGNHFIYRVVSDWSLAAGLKMVEKVENHEFYVYTNR